ncbi:hypothetical protein [Cohaesibacter gelatinilyticus]|uniref:Mobilisation protein (MobC) n=1 Tax=Cohaesibacter gelatinilyticus TaxID=372072 RepID=A0A285PN55_9HYPH|nr:hypothetical protein [Cohaesibacter gelatinilyticus]SNZ21321.1 hypothetical protein SAMN06265368_4438 [Cohaesibacter gelatinilyticus]
MSVKCQFNESAKSMKRKRPSPFCIRLSETQRARLADEASGVPLGAYIKAKALGEPLRRRRTGLSIEDREALAKTLALLGKSRLSSNLNQLAHAANIGSLPITPETEKFLCDCLCDVQEIRSLLMRALGLKTERDQ